MKKKIKLIHIISNLSLGGAQVLLYDILNNLKKKEDLDIKVITIDSGKYIEKFITSGIPVIDISEKGLVNPKILFKLKKILRDLKPDIVHTHLNKADFYGRIAAKQTGVPLIYSTCHNYSTTHKSADINKRSIFDTIDNLVVTYSGSRLIAVSNLVQQYLTNRDPKFKERTEIIYNGLNTDKKKYQLDENQQLIFRKTNRLSQDDFVISVIGRLEKQKGHLFFLDTVKEFLRKNSSIKVLIIGEGNLRNDIEKFVESNLLTNQIQLLGFKHDTEKYIEISDLVCVPSLWEAFGLVTIEAMIKGKLVLASNTGGIPEIVEDFKNGFLFETGNSKDLLKKLKYIFENKNTFSDLRKNAIEDVINKFDIQKNSELYYKSYLSKLNLSNK